MQITALSKNNVDRALKSHRGGEQSEDPRKDMIGMQGIAI